MSHDAPKIFHADHGVTEETIDWALTKIGPVDGFFIRTLKLPPNHPDLMCSLYGPLTGDLPVDENDVTYKERGERPYLSRMTSRPPRPTRLLTMIGNITKDGVFIYTAYGGNAALREPGDPSLSTAEEKKESLDFWLQHALSNDV